MGGLCKHLKIEALRQQLAQWEGGAAWQKAIADSAALEHSAIVSSGAVISSGAAALDRILPENGFRRGTLVEWLGGSQDGDQGSGQGDGAATLAFRAAAQALRIAAETPGDGRAVVVLDASGEFYPPAATQLGIEPARLIVVHPGNKADHTWALDQVLRCPAVAAAVAWPDQAVKEVVGCGFSPPSGKGGLKPTLRGKLDGRTFRRLQLAAEQGGGLGLLIRPAAVRGEPSWADVRLLVEPLPSTSPYGRPRRMRVTVLRCRGGRGEQTVEVEIDEEIDDGPPRMSES